MSDFAARLERLRYRVAHQELHDLSPDKTILAYHTTLLWLFAVAIIEGSYE